MYPFRRSANYYKLKIIVRKNSEKYIFIYIFYCSKLSLLKILLSHRIFAFGPEARRFSYRAVSYTDQLSREFRAFLFPRWKHTKSANNIPCFSCIPFDGWNEYKSARWYCIERTCWKYIFVDTAVPRNFHPNGIFSCRRLVQLSRIFAKRYVCSSRVPPPKSISWMVEVFFFMPKRTTLE